MNHLLSLSLSLSLSLLPLHTLADSAPNFPIQVNQQLGTYFDWSDHYHDVSEDHHVTNDDALYAPQIYKPSNETGDDTYLAIMVDSDADDNGRKVQLLQWLQPNLRGTPRLLLADATAENATNNAGAFYYPPSPPENSGRHYYTIVVYRQPEDWEVGSKYASFCPPENVTARAPFDIEDFVKESKLEYAIATNYFYVDANSTKS